MKRTLLISILTFVVFPTYAQPENRCFTYSTTIGTGIAMNSPSKTPFTWQFLGYYNITQRVAVGVGTGISVYEKPLLPLFADIKFRIIKPRLVTPYIECGAGYSFSLTRNSNGGFYLSPNIGTEFRLSPKIQLLFGVGYELQKLKQLKKSKNDYFASEFSEELIHNSITFKIGVLF